MTAPDSARPQEQDDGSISEALRDLGRLALICRPYWNEFFRTTAFGLAGTLLGLIAPYLSKLLVDKVYPNRSIPLLAAVVAGMAIVSAAGLFIGTLRGYLTQVMFARLSTATSLMFTNHVQRLPLRFFEDRRVGEITSRLGDLRTSLNTLSTLVGSLLTNGLYLLLVPLLLTVIDWRLAAISTAALPLTLALNYISARISRRYAKETAARYATSSATTVETLAQIKVIKGHQLERSFSERIRAELEAAAETQLRGAAAGAVFRIVIGGIRAVSTALVSWFAWRWIIAGELTLGDLFAFQAYIGYVTAPLSTLTMLGGDLQRASVSLRRAFEFLDRTPEPPRVPVNGSSLTGRPSVGITLDRVDFGYLPERRILTECSVALPPRAKIGIVGPSGAGKSTLLRLVCGMESPEVGRMIIEPGDRVASASDLREETTLVWQDSGMLSGTLAYNLAPDGIEHSHDRMEEVLEACQLRAFVRALPLGLRTNVSEFGASLSAGQRQRISIARALLRDRPVIAFDESTAHLDAATELELLAALMPLLRDRMVLFVSHREPPLKFMDCLLRVDATGVRMER